MVNAKQYAKQYDEELRNKLIDWIDKAIKEAVRERKDNTNFIVSNLYYPVMEDVFSCYRRSCGYTFTKILTEAEHTIFNVSWRD